MDHVVRDSDTFHSGMFSSQNLYPIRYGRKLPSLYHCQKQAHLQHRDQWWKPLGFLILAIHWLNPLVWAAYILEDQFGMARAEELYDTG